MKTIITGTILVGHISLGLGMQYFITPPIASTASFPVSDAYCPRTSFSHVEFAPVTLDYVNELNERAVQSNVIAASHGDSYGLLRMGERYRDGDGVPQNLSASVYYLTQAIEKGSPSAQSALDLTKLKIDYVSKENERIKAENLEKARISQEKLTAELQIVKIKTDAEIELAKIKEQSKIYEISKNLEETKIKNDTLKRNQELQNEQHKMNTDHIFWGIIIIAIVVLLTFVLTFALWAIEKCKWVIGTLGLGVIGYGIIRLFKSKNTQKSKEIIKNNTEFSFLDSEGNEQGTYTGDQIKDLLQDGTITDNTQIYIHGKLFEWKELSTFNYPKY
jgi:hypothetical protein